MPDPSNYLSAPAIPPDADATEAIPCATFPADIRFCFPWRKYQARVLKELDAHLNDGHLHVIAPPGSGKTVLGLEVVRRLNRPAVLLSPTLPVRNQWADRFSDLFLPAKRRSEIPEWVSADLGRPGVLTTSTYQSVHLLMKRKGAAAVLAGLKKRGVKTLVLDEAHHLQNEWWKSLDRFTRGLDDPVTVALTATPPRDASPEEWRRYTAACGPVDAEITVPELVREGSLCPHQDYLYFTFPQKPGRAKDDEKSAGDKERDQAEYENTIARVMECLHLSPEFLDAAESHLWMRDPFGCADQILDDIPYAFALATFIASAGRYLSPEIRELTGIPEYAPGSDEKISGLPEMTTDRLEILLTRVLHKDSASFSEAGPVLNTIRKDLKRAGALSRRQVRLMPPAERETDPRAATRKLEGIRDILIHEHTSLGDRLRLVILTDFIYQADMPTWIDDLKPIRRLGVVPIFEFLRRAYIPGLRLGVLTGSLVILPESVLSDLRISAAIAGVDAADMETLPLDHDPGYLTLRISGRSDREMIPLMTGLLVTGRVNALIGTRALLGEGWDAPCINTLIMASAVGAHVSSAQMRGRAIRLDADVPEKAANIWHLIHIHPDAGHHIIGNHIAGNHITGRRDREQIHRRFQAYVGPGRQRDIIESGIRRLDIPDPPLSRETAEGINREMIAASALRDEMARRWERAIFRVRDGGVMRERMISRPAALRRRLRIRQISPAWKSFLFRVSGFVIFAFPTLAGQGILQITAAAGAVAFGLGALRALPSALGLVVRRMRNGAEGMHLHQAGEIVRDTLQYFELIAKSDISGTPPKVSVEREEGNVLTCALVGAADRDNALFLDLMQELIDPPERPRYILRLPGSGKTAGDATIIPVPGVLGRRKERAVLFHSLWRKRIGPADLLFTRDSEGKAMLLRAGMRLCAESEEDGTERGCRWV